MGGNAIKDPKTGVSRTCRLEKAQYELVKKVVLDSLRDIDMIAENVLDVPGKTDFGDLDVLYVLRPDVDMQVTAKKMFRVTDDSHIVVNGTVISFAFQLQNDTFFQVDLIKINSIEELEAARFFFSYGDVGSIVGRIFNYYGMKYGDSGLWLDLVENTVDPTVKFDNSVTFGKIMLSQNIGEILRYAGLDYDYWKNVIPTLNGDQHACIFKWIMTSPLFTPEIFCILNSSCRSRREKRPFYGSFLQYIGITDVEKTGDSVDNHQAKITTNLQHHAIEYFKKHEELKRFLMDRDRRNKFKRSELIDLYKTIHNVTITEKNIGIKMVAIKSALIGTSLKTWNEFLDAHTKEEIDALIIQLER